MLTGKFASERIIPILVTGLLWTDVWGGMLKSVQSYTRQESPSRAFGGKPILSAESAEQSLSYERIIEIARQSGAHEPYEHSEFPIYALRYILFHERLFYS